jgi:hypothetical protein
MNLSTQDEAMLAAAVARPPEGKASSGLGAAPVDGGVNKLAARLLPSLTDVAFLAPIIFLFARSTGARMLLGDSDTGWHIRCGQWIIANGRVPDRDIFSFTKYGQPWFAWEWLWDVAFGWMHGQWGLAAVVLVSLIVICTTGALVYRLALRKSGSPLISIALTLTAIAASSIHWLARPHLFTLLFVAVFCWLIERAQAGETRLLLWLPPLTILWTNLHGGFVCGVILLAAYAVGDLTSWATDRHSDARSAALVRARRYALTAGACAVASLVNPYGWQLHLHIARYLTDPWQLQNIMEFQTLNFQHPAAKYFELLLLGGAITAAWNIYRRRFAYAILLGVWAHVAMTSGRNIPIYMILAVPPIAACLAELTVLLNSANVRDWVRKAVRGFEDLESEVGTIERIRRIPVLCPLMVISIGFLLHVQPGERFRAEFSPKDFPVKAAEALRGPEFTTGVFSDDQWGGYLIYRLFPNHRVFIDGRSDFYGAGFDTKYQDIMNVKWNWEAVLNQFPVHTVLLPVADALAGALKLSPRWRPVYDDGTAIIFRRSTPAGTLLAAAAPEDTQVPAVQYGGLSAIARSRTPQSVIEGSQSYARR